MNPLKPGPITKTAVTKLRKGIILKLSMNLPGAILKLSMNLPEAILKLIMNSRGYSKTLMPLIQRRLRSYSEGPAGTAIFK